MASEKSASSRQSVHAGGAAGAGGAGAGEARVHHARSFKLRFATPREPGRSDVSLVKPLGIPAIVAGKFYARSEGGAGVDERALQAACARVHDLFARGPRDSLARPLLSSHEYGWWSAAAAPPAPALRHHIRDSPWMRERLRLLPRPRYNAHNN